MAKVGMAPACRHDQIVKRQAASIRLYKSFGHVDCAHLGHENLDIAPVNNRSYGLRNVRRRECRGGDLVEQRLKHIVILLVDQGDLDRCIDEFPHRSQTTETSTDDYDLWHRPYLPWGGSVHDPFI
jgi:hypothetical protein